MKSKMRRMRKTDHGQPRLTRRAVLTGTLAAAAAAVNRPALAQPPSPEASAAQGAPVGAPSRQGRLPNELGICAPQEQPRRLPIPTSSRTPLQDLHGTITPADLHFERHHAGVAVIDPRTYRLLVHGLVERPMTFTLDDLKRFPAASRICFLECSGNFTRTGGEKTTAQALCGLTSQSEWTGVRLATLLREVGARPQASWFLAEGQDAAQMTRSIPLKEVLEEAMIAYAQNGEIGRAHV